MNFKTIFQNIKKFYQHFSYSYHFAVSFSLCVCLPVCLLAYLSLCIFVFMSVGFSLAVLGTVCPCFSFMSSLAPTGSPAIGHSGKHCLLHVLYVHESCQFLYIKYTMKIYQEFLSIQYYFDWLIFILLFRKMSTTKQQCFLFILGKNKLNWTFVQIFFFKLISIKTKLPGPETFEWK